MQLPLQQSWLGPQTLPQAPQLLGSLPAAAIVPLGSLPAAAIVPLQQMRPPE
jgi:hypothetical protein